MIKRTLLTAIVTAAVAAVATPAISHAQTPQVSKGEVAMKPSFVSLMSALNATAAATGKIKALTEVPAANVQLVNAEDLVKGNSPDSLTAALTKNEADVTALRTALGANTSVAGVLSGNTTPLTPADVIAADVGADGKLVLYYWKKPA